MAFTGDISPAVRSHLQKVYMMAFVALAVAAAGASAHVFWYPGGYLTWCGILGGVGLMMAASRRKLWCCELRIDLLFLMGVSLWEGFSVGPGIRMSLCCYPLSIFITVVMGAAVTFGSLMGSALVAKRREFLFLGGLISSIICFFFWLDRVSNIFGPSAGSFRTGVYVRVLVFQGYLMFDTLEILERASAGDLGYLRHALILSSDFFSVMAPLVVILVKMSLRSEEISSYILPAQPVVNPLERERVKQARYAAFGVDSALLLACGVVPYLFD